MKKPREVILTNEDGVISYWEYENYLWIMDIRATRAGAGNRLMRKLKKIVTKIGKPMYAQILPTKDGGMSAERLRKWYLNNGAEEVWHPASEHAIRFEAK